MCKLSIVVPIYNKRKYLYQCVDSICHQSYRNMEIILVDDGSTDGCSEICDEYALRDNRIKVIHQKNGGLSSARNAGLAQATGEYVGFVDSDDYVTPDMYDRLLKCIIRTEKNIAICRIRIVDEMMGLGKMESQDPFLRETAEPDEVAKWMMKRGGWIYVTACNKLYKKELFEDLLFEQGKLYEDEFLAHRIFDRSNGVGLVPQELYCYRRNAESITTGELTVRSFDMIEALYDRMQFYENNRKENLVKQTASLLMAKYSELKCKVKLKDKQDRRRIREMDGMFRCAVYKRGNINLMKKGIALISPSVYSFFRSKTQS